MRFHRFVCVAALGMACSTVSCGDGRPLPKEQASYGIAECGERPPNLIGVNSIDGSGTTNGLSSELFHKYKSRLESATWGPIEGPIVDEENGTEVSDHIKETILKEESFNEKPLSAQESVGVAIFRKAVACAVPKGRKLTFTPEGQEPIRFEGGGILKSTGAWLNGSKGLHDMGYNEDAWFDLLSCMFALLNPYGHEVGVVMSGPNVNNNGDHWCYQVPEALWQVTSDNELAQEYKVWPLDGLREALAALYDPKDGCMQTTEKLNWLDVLKLRVCGRNATFCNLTEGGNIEDECTKGEDGQYLCTRCTKDERGRERCEPKPAMQTTLKSIEDAQKLYCPSAM